MKKIIPLILIPLTLSACSLKDKATGFVDDSKKSYQNVVDEVKDVKQKVEDTKEKIDETIEDVENAVEAVENTKAALIKIAD